MGYRRFRHRTVHPEEKAFLQSLLRSLPASARAPLPGVGARGKYGNRRVQVDGIWFDSQAEAKRYGELKLLEKAGRLEDLLIHPRFPFKVTPAGPFDRNLVTPFTYAQKVAFTYVADFSYFEDGAYIVEDVKSVATRTAVYKLKKKLIESQYGITITEVMV